MKIKKNIFNAFRFHPDYRNRDMEHVLSEEDVQEHARLGKRRIVGEALSAVAGVAAGVAVYHHTDNYATAVVTGAATYIAGGIATHVAVEAEQSWLGEYRRIGNLEQL